MTLDGHERAVIVAAIEEVWDSYYEAGWTMDGVIDVGDRMQALGELVGRDLREEAAELKKAAEEFEL